MKFLFTPRFTRLYRKFPVQDQKRMDRALDYLASFFFDQKKTWGLGMRRLSQSVWEIRVGLKIRVIFSVDADTVKLLYLGSHEDIQRFLKNV